MTTDTYKSTATEESADDVRQKAEQTAQTIVSQAQDVASSQANTQMTRAASLLDGLAQSLRQTGESIRSDQPQIASFADQTVDRVEGISSYLRDHDFNDVVRDAESYAKREPLIFLGAAFAAGFIAARFLKASAPQSGSRARYGVMDRSSVTRPSDSVLGERAFANDYGREYATQSTGSSWSGGTAATTEER